MFLRKEFLNLDLSITAIDQVLIIAFHKEWLVTPYISFFLRCTLI